MILKIAIVALCAALNRARGDSRWMGKTDEDGDGYLPGHARFYVSAAIALVAWLAGHSVTVSALTGAAYLVWCWMPWGYLQLLGRPAPEGKVPTGIEKALLRASGGNVHVALFLRHAAVLPGAVLLFGWFGPTVAFIFAVLAIGGYELGWKYAPRAPILVGELYAGLMWGVMIVMGTAPWLA